MSGQLGSVWENLEKCVQPWYQASFQSGTGLGIGIEFVRQKDSMRVISHWKKKFTWFQLNMCLSFLQEAINTFIKNKYIKPKKT